MNIEHGLTYIQMNVVRTMNKLFCDASLAMKKLLCPQNITFKDTLISHKTQIRKEKEGESTAWSLACAGRFHGIVVNTKNMTIAKQSRFYLDVYLYIPLGWII